MASRGKNETEILKSNLFSQLDRLIVQLHDCEQLKDDLSPEEYEETKRDTIEQLNEFNQSLSKMKSGNLSLIDDVNAMQIAIQGAISDAFKTPEVIQMFARKEQPQLKQRLAEIEQGIKLGKIGTNDGLMQKVEILCALKKLGEKLSESQEEFLNINMNASLKQFSVASNSISNNLLTMAGSKINEASN